jgi:hypothetical protein
VSDKETNLMDEPQTRADLIASYSYGAIAPAEGDTPAAPAAPATDEKPQPAVSHHDADGTVQNQIMAIGAAINAATEAQGNDPDAGSDPNDQAVEKLLGQMKDTYGELLKAQANDMAEDKPEDPAAPKPPAAAKPDPAPAPAPAQTAAGPVPPPKTPVPATGDQDPDIECQSPGCTHPASVHQNTGEGANTGSCTTPGCDCTGLTVAAAQAQETPGQVEDPGSESALADAPDALEEPPAAATEANAPPFVPGGDNMGPTFTIPVGVIEGQPTGDGREIASGALTWRQPPAPLMWMKTSAHDPSGMSGNDPAVLCGRIDSYERAPGENGTQIISAKGFLLNDPHGVEAATAIEQMGRLGVSADIAIQAEQMTPTEVDADGFPVEMTSTLLEGQIMGFTITPFPAFGACYIVLGDGTATDPIPQQVDDQVASGQTIHWMTFEECRACDTTDVLVAAGGPVRPPADWFTAPNFEDGDGRLQEIHTKRDQTQLACPLTVTADGRVYGHIAPWGVCHTSFPGKCITPPRSSTDYAHFKRGEVLTAEGDYLPVGVITANTGHASLAAGASGAMAHYDDTGTVTAWVNSGEDEYGIWVAGAIDPDATEEQVATMRACGISGDWRNGELVAALSVPVPGYPLARVQGRQEALVASGAKIMFNLAHPEQHETAETHVDHALRASLAPLVQQSAKLARGRIGATSAAQARARIARR